MKQFKDINLTTYATTALSSYDPQKISLGDLIVQMTQGSDKFLGPKPVAIARPFEESLAIAAGYPFAIDMGNNRQWVFIANQSTAGTTRILALYEFNKLTVTYSWKGYITLAFPSTGNHTTRSFRVSLEHYTTGTVAVAGTAVTGTGTTWQTDRISAGAVIGFGSADSTQISQWFEIASFQSDTGLTLASNAGTIAAGTPYVIREILIPIVTTNSTVANGGLFVAKGISELDFAAARTIAAATTVDLLKAVYWLADAATVTNTVACGCALDNKISQTEQNVYVPNFVAPNYKIYVYNIRQPLTDLAAGKSLVAFRFATGNQAYVGTASQANNARLGTLGHSVAAGVKSLFVATTTRVYRAPLTAITEGATAFFTDLMVEVPPGGTSVSPLSSVLQAVEVAGAADVLLITTTNATALPSYATKYNTSSQQFDLMFITDDKLYNYNSTPASVPIYPNSLSLSCQLFAESGFLHICRSVASTSCALYCVPYAADYNWADTTGQYMITPEILTPGATKLYQLWVNSRQKMGDDPFSVAIEPFRVYYRTTGIADNTGAWTLLGDSGDLSGISPAASIQFKFTFKILGPTCIPARLYGLVLTYEDDQTDSHYLPSVAQSSAAGRVFAWRQADGFGGSLPVLTIKIYNADTGALLLSDDTEIAAFGSWEYSTNSGAAWNLWDDSQDSVGNYIRYIATSLPSGIKVRVMLTQ